jgi:hypothetical protein
MECIVIEETRDKIYKRILKRVEREYREQQFQFRRDQSLFQNFINEKFLEYLESVEKLSEISDIDELRQIYRS